MLLRSFHRALLVSLALWASATAQVSYHGGRVLEDIRLRLLWYGDWRESAADVELIEQLARDIGDSPWLHAVHLYGAGRSVTLAGSLQLSGSNTLQPADILRIGAGFSRPGEVAVVLTGRDITVTGWCKAWHWFLGETPVIWVGSPKRCWPQEWETLNRRFEADLMANWFLHELAEAATNPFFDAWHGPEDREIGDLCQGVDRPTRIGSNTFLVQRLWVNEGGYCTSLWSPPAPRRREK